LSDDEAHALLEDKGLLQPPDATKLLTADAVSMYTIIDMRHTMTVFHQRFRDYSEEIPSGFPKMLFLTVLELIMARNVFSFDETVWL
jgi:hypothetical protein